MRLKRLIQKKTKKFIIKTLSNDLSTLFQAYNLSELNYCEIPYVKVKFKKKSILANKNEIINLKIDGQILPKILKTGTFDPFLFNFLKKKNLKNVIFIDVGANHGLISKQVSNLKFVKKIITFEPFNKVYKLLEKNLRNNVNIKNYNYGWANKNTSLSFFENPTNSGDLSLIVNKQRKIKHICKFKNCQHELSRIIKQNKKYQFILKTDCQGYDVEILNTLKNENLKKLSIYFLECKEIPKDKRETFYKKIGLFKKILVSCPLIHQDLRKITPNMIGKYLSYKVEFDLILLNL